MTDIVSTHVETYCHKMTNGESELLKELAKATREKMRYPNNMSGPLVGQTLKMLAAVSGSCRVLEIGMFTGYAALSIAEVLPESGIVYCCENNPRAIALGQSYFDRSPHGHKIQVLPGKALETIPQISDPLDMVFIDADKKTYFHYLTMVLPMVKTGGVIVVDDALWRGRVMAPEDDRSHVIAELNAWVARQPDLENVLLPIRHGLNIIRKCSPKVG